MSRTDDQSSYYMHAKFVWLAAEELERVKDVCQTTSISGYADRGAHRSVWIDAPQGQTKECQITVTDKEISAFREFDKSFSKELTVLDRIFYVSIYSHEVVVAINVCHDTLQRLAELRVRLSLETYSFDATLDHTS